MVQIEKLEARKKRLEFELQNVRRLQRKENRKRDTRRKILIGSLALKLLKENKLDRELIYAELDKFLTKEIDRQLFKKLK